jgi:hypothetical protein
MKTEMITPANSFILPEKNNQRHIVGVFTVRFLRSSYRNVWKGRRAAIEAGAESLGQSGGCGYFSVDVSGCHLNCLSPRK